MSSKFDPEGYYECLGIQLTADADAVKRAYRELAKKYHPDINRDPTAKAVFQKISAAYAVLSDPEARNKYDSLRYAKPTAEPEQEKLSPICCSHCGKITAQPRATVFFRVVSFVLATTKTPIQGIFCSDCAKKLSLRASLVSALFGWWGFPWGPIWTISSICTNATGGKQSQELTERLTWYNAVAFLSQGSLAIAYALAQQSRRASDLEISLKAAKLIDYLRSKGLPDEAPTLKNPWSNPWLAAAHILLLLLIPGVIGLAVAYDDISKPSGNKVASQPYIRPSAPNYHVAQTNPPKPDFSAQAIPSPTPPAPAAIPVCSIPPYNGKMLVNKFPAIPQGHSIEIKNGSNANALIKVRDAATGLLRASFFVLKGNVAEIKNLPDGSYKIQYAFGSDLGADCRSFARPLSAAEFPGIETLKIEYVNATQFYTQQLSYTLYSVPGGNIRPQSLDIGSFNAD